MDRFKIYPQEGEIMVKFGQVIFKNRTWMLTWTGSYKSKVPTEIRIEKLTAPTPANGGIDYFIYQDRSDNYNYIMKKDLL